MVLLFGIWVVFENKVTFKIQWCLTILTSNSMVFDNSYFKIQWCLIIVPFKRTILGYTFIFRHTDTGLLGLKALGAACWQRPTLHHWSMKGFEML